VRLGEVRGSTAEDLVLLLEQPVPLFQLPELRALRRRHARPNAVMDVRAARPVRHRSLGDPEVLPDLRQGDLAPTSDDVASELLRIRPSHDRHPSTEDQILRDQESTEPAADPPRVASFP